MKKNIFLKILTALCLSSCTIHNDRISLFGCNNWYDLKTKEYNYYDCKLNLSLYLEQNYFVLGVILGKNETCTIHFQFYSNKIKNPSYDVVDSPLDYEKVIYTDSTGAKVNFNGPVGYTFNSSRTIKYDYSNWDEETKNIFNNSTGFSFKIFSDGFSYSKSKKENISNKVDFGDDLSKVKI